MDKLTGWLLREKYNGKPTGNFYKDKKRLKAGEPIDYVIGFTEFLGCKIDLSKKPLIPRPETEFWVEKTINELHHISHDRRDYDVGVLDMFAGSGCIGIAILRHVKNVQVDFADKEIKSIQQIKINCQLNNINKKGYKIIKSDIFSNIKGKYNYIFANPPYIPATARNRIQKSVLNFEPKIALFGGNDGLFYIRKFLKQAKNYLNPGGIIFVEFSPEQKKEIEKLLVKYNYQKYEFHKDQYNRWRWVKIS